MTRGVSIDVLGVDVGSVLDKRLDYAQVTSQARDVERRSEVVGPSIHLGTKLDQYLDQRSVALTCCQVKRCESVRIGAVDNLEELIFEIELLFGILEYLLNFIGIALVHFGPVVYLYLLDVFLPLFLLR